MDKAMSPRPEVPVIQEAPEERVNGNSNGHTEPPSSAPSQQAADAKEQPPQSYLALTKLGNEKKPAQNQTPTAAPAQQGSKKQVKRNALHQDSTNATSGGIFSFVKGR